MWTAISSLMWLKPVKLPLRFMQSTSLQREEQVPWLHRVRKHSRPVPENVFCEVCPLQWLQEHLPGPQAETTALKGYTKPQGRARAGRGRAPGLEVPPVPPPPFLFCFVLFCLTPEQQFGLTTKHPSGAAFTWQPQRLAQGGRLGAFRAEAGLCRALRGAAWGLGGAAPQAGGPRGASPQEHLRRGRGRGR